MDLQSTLARDGYAVIRDALPHDFLQAIRLQIQDVGGPALAGGRRASTWDNQDQRDIFARLQALEDVHALAASDAIVDAVSALWRQPLCHPRKNVRLKHPTSGGTMPHQDFASVGGSVDVVTVWIPLHECGPSTGGLYLCEGSHLRGLFRSVVGADGQTGVSEVAVTKRRSFEFEQGDMVIFHSLTVHGAWPTAKARLSLDFRYQSLDSPVDASRLAPHPARRYGVTSWNEVARDWKMPSRVDVPSAALAINTRSVDPATLLTLARSDLIDSTVLQDQVADGRVWVVPGADVGPRVFLQSEKVG